MSVKIPKDLFPPYTGSLQVKKSYPQWGTLRSEATILGSLQVKKSYPQWGTFRSEATIIGNGAGVGQKNVKLVIISYPDANMNLVFSQIARTFGENIVSLQRPEGYLGGYTKSVFMVSYPPVEGTFGDLRQALIAGVEYGPHLGVLDVWIEPLESTTVVPASSQSSSGISGSLLFGLAVLLIGAIAFVDRNYPVERKG